MVKSIWVAGLAALAVAASLPAHAGKKDDTLVWASQIDPPSLDYYRSSQRETTVFMNLIWDTLVQRDPEKSGVYKPQLAKSWAWIDTKTLEFELRSGIKFTNGEDLDASDVKFTLDYVKDPKNRALLQPFFLWVDRVEVVDPLKVRLHLTGQFLGAFEYLAASTPIYPKDTFEKMGAEAFGKAPIGTGPYMITEVSPGKQIVAKKNPNYFKDSPRGQPAVGTLVFRPIPENTTQMAELASGGVDWIWRFELDQGDMLKTLPNVSVDWGGSMRIGYLQMDVTGKAGKSPFMDKKVRQAVAHAIDREAMVKNLVKGNSELIHAICMNLHASCAGDKVRKYEYSPAKAKQLLAEAGYPNGFEIDFWSYRDRGYSEVVINYLNAVGIRAKLQHTRYPTLRTKLHKNDGVAIAYMTYEGASIRDVSVVTDYFFTGGPEDYALDTKLQAMLEEARYAAPQGKRDEAYLKALSHVAEEVLWVPMFTYPYSYAWSKELEFQVPSDGMPRFEQVRWK